MKQPKKPTREQKIVLQNAGLNWKDWNIMQDVTDAPFQYMDVVNKKTGEKRRLWK